MDFTLSPETGAIRDLATRILHERSTPERLAALDAGGDWLDQPTYQQLAGAGLIGAALPEDVGGAGLGLLELHYVLEQVGATTAHVPLLESVVLGALTIDRFGTPAQRHDWLPGVITGHTLLTAAHTEPGPADPRRPQTRARRAGPGWVLHGSKSQVPLADAADRIVVPASTDDGMVAMFLVDPRAEGVSLVPQVTVERRPACALDLAGVAVGEDDRIGGGGDVLADLLLRTESALASLQSGVCAAALRLAARHTRSREQFGRPIGTFQAVGQQLADAWIDAEAVRLTSLQAAWRLSAGLDATEAVTIAKWWAAEAGHRVLHAAHHVHGGTGIDLSYPLHRYFLLGKQIEFSLGNASQQLSALGKALAAQSRGPTTCQGA
jgi:alkylation response protein AidB-like acyl-CoA dehydrogenase